MRVLAQTGDQQWMRKVGVLKSRATIKEMNKKVGVITKSKGSNHKKMIPCQTCHSLELDAASQVRQIGDMKYVGLLKIAQGRCISRLTIGKQTQIGKYMEMQFMSLQLTTRCAPKEKPKNLLPACADVLQGEK